MTEALYTHNAYHIVYDSRKEMQALPTRMGAPARQGAAHLPEVPITVLEQGTPEGKKVMPPPKDPLKYVEHIERLRKSHLGKTPSKETREKLSKAKKGVLKSQEHKNKISAARKQHYIDHPETRTKLSESKKGIKNPMFGTHHTKEWCKRIGDMERGDKCHLWRGGISFEPYCVKFNNEFKERVRAFFGYICQGCNAPQNGERLHIHHVNFRKDACCAEDVIPLFVPLCRSCHGKTQFNRDYWQEYFTEMITSKYDGKCYFTKEEMAK